MAVMDAALEFSDAQAVTLSSTATVTSTNVADMRTGNKDAWGTARNPDIGGTTLNVVINTALAGAGGTLTPKLVTKADASISSGATVIATLEPFAAAAVAGTKRSIRLAPGTTSLRYVGVLYTGGATISAGKVDTWLGLDNELTD